MFRRERGPVAPKPEDITAIRVGSSVELRWRKPKGLLDGYIVFAGLNVQQMKELSRIENPNQTHIVITEPIEDEVYSVVTYRGARVSESVFASVEGPVVSGAPASPSEAITEIQEQRTEAPASIVADDKGAIREMQQKEDQKHDVCIGCEGSLELDVEKGGRARKVLKCKQCGKEHVKSARGRLFLVEQLDYGCCVCPECEEMQILVTRGEKIICSKTGREHAVYKRGREISKTVLANILQYGFCSCCSPRMPLEFQDGKFNCYAKPDIQYVRVGTSNNFRMRHPGEVGVNDERRRLLSGTLDVGPMGLPTRRR